MMMKCLATNGLKMLAAPLAALMWLGCGDDGGTEEEPGTQDDTGTATEVDTEEEQIAEEVERILADLTLEEKAGQMVQAQYEDTNEAMVRAMCIGSVFNGGEIPISPNEPVVWARAIDTLQEGAMAGCGIPIMYGIDAVHGNAKVIGSTVFPHGIGLGATGDADLVARVGQATGRECRAVGIHLTFTPSVSVARDERWGRTYEGLGETAELNSELGAAYVMGLQGMGDLSDPGAIAATAKHYMGDGGTTGGINNGLNEFGDETMRALHLPPYKAAVEQDLAAVMPSYHKWLRDGEEYPMTTDHYSLTEILKDELGFKGFALSDYDAIPQSAGLATATYEKEGVAAAVNAGLDMAMIAADPGAGDFIDAIYEGVNDGTIEESRIDDAVRRILRIKIKMGLFEYPWSNPDLMETIWSEEHQELAREAVQKSQVLLKNENDALPIDRDEDVVVAGPDADRMGGQAGGWTVGWQGSANYTTDQVMGETILTGMEEVGGNVTYDQYGDDLSGAEKVVVVLGERPYAEGYGDHGTGSSSVILEEQLDYYVLESAMASDAQIVLVLISGRPLIISDEVLNRVDAIVAAWLPGSRGIGIADNLYGDAEFTGKLPHTWPASFDQIPINVGKFDDEPGVDADDVEPLYPLGYGLSL